jgi:heptosyltransferase-2
MNTQIFKIAVIQTAFPGDVILSTPVFEALNDKFPGCQITAVVRPESEILLRHNPYINNIMLYDKYGADKGISGIFRIAKKLKGHNTAIIIQRHLRSALIAYIAGIKKRVGYDRASASFLYTDKVKYDKTVHEVDRVLDLIKVDNRGKKYKPKLYFDNDTERMADDLIKSTIGDSPFAVLCPGSVWPTKRYPQYDRLAKIINSELKLPVILVGGNNDKKMFNVISKAGTNIYNFAGVTNIMQSAAVISKAKFVISNDSAPAHLSAAVSTPIIAIFGPTAEGFGFIPYSEKSKVVDIGKLYCRPCSSHGSKKCPEGHFKCMNELSPEFIIDAVKSLVF